MILSLRGNDAHMIEEFKREMMMKYEMSDMGLLKYFLGIEVHQSEDAVFNSQRKYAERVLKKFGMLGCNPTSTPPVVNEKLKKDDGGRKVDETYYRGLIGKLLYLTHKRPDIMFASSMFSRFMSSPSHLHLGAEKRLLRYIQGTMNFGIMYSRNLDVKLVGYCDSDLGGCIDDMKSTSGYAFSLGSGIFTWASKKQETVALSTAEAEYISSLVATSHVVWLRRIMEDIQEKQEKSTVIFVTTNPPLLCPKNRLSIVEQGTLNSIITSFDKRLKMVR
ncbi:uncharacterized protein LOC113327958 [Papaver somniferum]|uniref:uncharacterized protein LOC113327958 n=1 Tax=Papaver somniferum TaxID=3469 RepID=UPI000E702B48|nr:uncharacterized protein LOC113327958 [Papaver somniferum]